MSNPFPKTTNLSNASQLVPSFSQQKLGFSNVNIGSQSSNFDDYFQMFLGKRDSHFIPTQFGIGGTN